MDGRRECSRFAARARPARCPPGQSCLPVRRRWSMFSFNLSLCSYVNCDHLWTLGLHGNWFAFGSQALNVASYRFLSALNALLYGFSLCDTPRQCRNRYSVSAFFGIGFKDNSVFWHHYVFSFALQGTNINCYSKVYRLLLPGDDV